MTTTLLNPFSVSLKKHPFMNVGDASIYTAGDYKIYKFSREHYVHTFKNIVIAQRCSANKDLIQNLLTDTKPGNETRAYFDFERGKEAIAEGIAAAKKLNFKIQ